MAISSICIAISQIKVAKASAEVKTLITLLKQGNSQTIPKLAQLEEELKQSETYWITYGFALSKQKNYSLSLQKFKNASRLKSNPDTYLQIAFCYQKLGKVDSAITAATLAKNIAPNRLSPLFYLMMIYVNKKDSVNGIAMAKQIVEMTPKIPSRQTKFYKLMATKILTLSFKKLTMTPKLFFTLLLNFAANIIVAQFKYPREVETALQQTKNKAELEKALQYFYKTGNPQKIESINFLIANMPIHQSYNYYWADESGKRVYYNELNYKTFKEAVDAFETLKKQSGKLHPVPYSYKDIDSITAKLLIEDVELALSAVNNSKIPNLVNGGRLTKDFLEYILPYRASVEPLENWRKIYTNKFSNLFNTLTSTEQLIFNFSKNITSWFSNSRDIAERREPLPRLSALQLLMRQNSTCDDISSLATFIARSQGLASTVDFVPAWGTSSGLHFSNYMLIPRSQIIIMIQWLDAA